MGGMAGSGGMPGMYGIPKGMSMLDTLRTTGNAG